MAGGNWSVTGSRQSQVLFSAAMKADEEARALETLQNIGRVDAILWPLLSETKEALRAEIPPFNQKIMHSLGKAFVERMELYLTLRVRIIDSLSPEDLSHFANVKPDSALGEFLKSLEDEDWDEEERINMMTDCRRLLSEIEELGGWLTPAESKEGRDRAAERTLNVMVNHTLVQISFSGLRG
jgi:hypothetical protein